jgi:hypothetical protein
MSDVSYMDAVLKRQPKYLNGLGGRIGGQYG